MDKKIVLDDKSFKALSADSRIGILKSLNERRRTLSELSQKLELGNSTIKEHCDILVNADLIKQINEGRKWKYYELTSKGKKIISPNLMEEVKVLILLCASVFIVGGIVIMLLPWFNHYNPTNNQDLLLSESTNFLETRNTPIDTPLFSKSAGADSDYTINAQEEVFLNQKYSSEIITKEFYATSILISLMIGIIIGWIFLRKTI